MTAQNPSLVKRVAEAIRNAPPERHVTILRMDGDVVSQEGVEFVVTDESRAKAALEASDAEEAFALLRRMRHEYGSHLSVCGKTLVAVDNLLAKLPAAPTVENGLGYCPSCGAVGVSREKRPDGDDRCEAGHAYPSRNAVTTKPGQKP